MGDTTTKTTTTTTTATYSTEETSISIDMNYLVPQGILKIVEIIVCIIVFSLIASVRSVLSLLALLYGGGFYDGPMFAMAVGIIFFLTTLILLILFLFNLVEKIGGAKIWYIIDLILNVLAVLLFFIGFIVLCVYCSVRIASTNYLIDQLVAALVFAIVAVVLYILSIVFAMKSGQTPMINIIA